jgi:signal transduction histidine kinase
MISPESRLFCQLDGLTASNREQQRLKTLSELGLLEAESIPVFEEATQIVAHFLDIPICFLAIMHEDSQVIKSAVGLSRLGLMNEIATTRQIPRIDSFCTHVIDSHQVLAVPDTLDHPAFVNSLLVHQYGIRAYLGVPLLASAGHCLGTLAVMDLAPRPFSSKDIEFLELTARWCVSEFECQHLLKAQSATIHPDVLPSDANLSNLEKHSSTNQVQIELLSQLTQELRTPLTSVMGMTSVLMREIYGPLTNKQKEYLDIIHHSGQYLISLVNEILELAKLNGVSQPLNLTSVDIEMLCQQAFKTLEQTATRREQQIRLTVEPGHRIWLLDKDKVRQILYHIIFGVIQSSSAGSTVRVHVSRKGEGLSIAVWISHPWLGDGMPEEIDGQYEPTKIGSEEDWLQPYQLSEYQLSEYQEAIPGTASIQPQAEVIELEEKNATETLYKNLGLLLSRQLAEIHGGHLLVQGSLDTGYRCILHLPQLRDSAIPSIER